MSSIFRKTALDKISSPEQLDQVIVITPPSFWIAMLGAAVILLAAFLWSIFGRVPVNVSADGIYMANDGIHVVYAENAGIVEEVMIHDGDTVKKGSVIASLFSKEAGQEPGETMILSTADGYVMGIDIAEGNAVAQGSAVCRIVEQDRDSIQPDKMAAILYVPVESGRKIKNGMEVMIYPATLSQQEYGHINGTVSHVDEFVTGSGEMKNKLGDDSLVQYYAQQGPVVQVICTLNSDPSTKSGYEWSSKKGAEAELAPGTPVTADIVTEKKAPITMLIPFLKEKLTIKVEQGKPEGSN